MPADAEDLVGALSILDTSMAPSTIILAVNAGSSSLKSTLFEAVGKRLRALVSAEVSGFTAPPAAEKYTVAGQKTSRELPEIKSHNDAFEHILNTFLQDQRVPVIKSKDDIDFVCHRVVHGGDYGENQLITPESYHKIEGLDSVFHHSMPEAVTTYAIDQTMAKKKGLRKYGFHGISYSFILRAVSQHLDKDPSQTSMIALHLGSGASACAIRNGTSVDTTMGLTPLSGLPGGSRSGDVDPSLIFHYTSEASKLSPSSTKELHISTAEDILNKQSGWKALAGTTDFSKIADPHAPDSHKLALEIFIDRIMGYIGSYFVKLDGRLYAVVFAGGIGEKSALLRRRIIDQCRCLGFTIDSGKNESMADGPVMDITGSGHIKTLVCETDEEVCPDSAFFSWSTNPPTV